MLRAAAVACAGTACGGAAKPPKPPLAPVELTAEPEPDMSSSAELGGLDEREAEQSFLSSLDALQACVKDGLDRFAYMGGSIELTVKVDTNRRAARVWAAQSSLGERATEKCMFEALRSVAWPAPQGGAFGIARSSFEFDQRKGVPAPAVWDAGRVAPTLEQVDGSLDACRKSGEPASRLLVTLYIGDGGRALAGGAASEEDVDEAAVDCVVDALLAAQYPAPEQAPTKVRFLL